jgi:hypothetical protein
MVVVAAVVVVEEVAVAAVEGKIFKHPQKRRVLTSKFGLKVISSRAYFCLKA